MTARKTSNRNRVFALWATIAPLLALFVATTAWSQQGEEQAQNSTEQQASQGENQDAAEESQDKLYTDKINIIINLNNPCGLAVQPTTGDVYIADSAAHRVLRYGMQPSGTGHEITEVITDFPNDVYGKGPMYDVGPMGLLFLDGNTLVVGGGGNIDGEELLRFYELPTIGEQIKADEMKYTMGPIGPSETTTTGEGNFYALAKAGDNIFVTTNGDDTKGWVAKCTLLEGVPQEFAPFIATKVATQVDAPVGIATGPDGNLYVGQMGEITIPEDSLLTCYDPETGDMLWNAETTLFDVSAVAFHPVSGNLYCLDYGWMEGSKPGLYRLDIADGADETTKNITAVLVEPMDKPAAMAFNDDGSLFVVEFGTANEGDVHLPGKMWQFDGLE